ncbi:hypothetical protein Tco_0121441 [Tanacetum coccineum]
MSPSRGKLLRPTSPPKGQDCGLGGESRKHHQYATNRRIPYLVASKHKNNGCEALLNPSAVEPLVWPSQEGNRLSYFVFTSL